MGLFDSLFGRVKCAACGAEVGAPRRRKLKEEAICSDCASKLSPWFDGRKGSDIEDIRAQLAARDKNRSELLPAFSATKAFGDLGCFLINEEAGTFVAIADPSEGVFGNQRKVTRIDQVAARNPDVIGLDKVLSADLDIIETRHEEKHAIEGEMVSYDPKHWVYSYRFVMEVKVDHPYIGTIRVQLNDGTVQIANEGERLAGSERKSLAEWLLERPDLDLGRGSVVRDDASVRAQLARNSYVVSDNAFGFRCTPRNREEIARYAYLLAVARQVQLALLPNLETLAHPRQSEGAA